MDSFHGEDINKWIGDRWGHGHEYFGGHIAHESHDDDHHDRNDHLHNGHTGHIRHIGALGSTIGNADTKGTNMFFVKKRVFRTLVSPIPYFCIQYDPIRFLKKTLCYLSKGCLDRYVKNRYVKNRK